MWVAAPHHWTKHYQSPEKWLQKQNDVLTNRDIILKVKKCDPSNKSADLFFIAGNIYFTKTY